MQSHSRGLSVNRDKHRRIHKSYNVAIWAVKNNSRVSHKLLPKEHNIKDKMETFKPTYNVEGYRS